jgi:hypothetical protein
MGECRTERSVGLQREMHGLIQRCHLELTVGYGTPAPTARQGDPHAGMWRKRELASVVAHASGSCAH